MSSKSRKYTNRSKSQELLPNETNPAAGESVHVAGMDIPDEVLHVPESETSPLRFILMIGLVILLLVIFVVPTAFTNLGRGGGSDLPAFFTWDRPGHGVESFDEREVALEAQAMQEALGLDFFLGIRLDANAQQMSRAKMARLMVLDQLALDAGIRVPDIDLGKHLLGIPQQQAMFQRDFDADQGLEALRGYLRQNPSAEPNIRRLMRIQRMVDISAFAASQAGPAGIVEQWENQHTELLFDYVGLASADFDEAARAELPEDEELEAWLMALDGADRFKREDLSSPERRRIELVSYREGADVAKLMEAYPLPEEQDMDVLAQDYYNANSFRRFADPETGNIAQFEDEGIKAACLLEAPVKFAMDLFLDEQKPKADDGADPGLLLSSNPLGLSYLKTEMLTRDELELKPEFEDASFLANAFFTPVGAFSFAVTVGAKGPMILRVAEVEERVLPAFAEIKEKVADLWVSDRAPDLGREKLEALRDAFDVFVPEDEDQALVQPGIDEVVRRSCDEATFAGALSAAGYESQRRDWLDSGGSTDADPMAEDESHKFLNVSFSLKKLEEGEVAVELDSITKRLYLVRCAGRRAVDLGRMSPKDFERYRENDQSAMSNSLARSWDQEFLFEHFGLRFSEDSGVPNPGDEEFGQDDDV